MTAAGENMMSSMSIKERIRALNLQSQSVGAPDSPTRQSTTNRKQQLSGSSIKTPLPAVSALPVIADPSFLEPLPSTTTKSTSPLRSSPTSEKAQLFKAAKVIRKAFDTTEAGSNFLDGSHSYNSQPSSPNSRQTADDEGHDNFDLYEEELDATMALESWRNKGMASDGPTFHEVNSYHVNKTVGDDPTTPIIASYPEIRTTKAQSACGKEGALAIAGGYETKNNSTNESRPMEAGPADDLIITPSGNDTDEKRYESKSSQYTMASGEPYRAYARRSRLRSPRGSGLSPDGGSFVDAMDGTQSVTSAQSALSQSSLSQISSLSTRATRFLKDKKDRRKEAAFLTTGGDGDGGGGGDGEDAISNSKFDELAKDIVHNTLRGDASKQPNLHQAGGDVDEKNSESLTNQSSREWATVGSRDTPQTIDIRPSIPKKGGYISDLNRDVIYQDRPQDQSKHHDEYQFTPTYDDFHRINPNSGLQGYPTKEDQPQHNYDQTASLDGSMCSELKGKDLFDIHTGTRGVKDMKKQSAFSRIDNACSESNSEFTAFQHGVGKSFDTGCQVLESMNPLPLIESAFNALSARSQAKGVFFSDSRKSVPRNTARSSDGDAPFDEDAPPDEPVSETVAIEVEYVEHGDEHHSMAETDSVFSVSTRDLESINT
jgi:hypothetical protein